MSPFTGQVYKIRKINLYEFIRYMGVLPADFEGTIADLMKKAFGEIQEKSKSDPEINTKTVEFMISKGVKSPKIFFGDSEKCPEGQIAFEDLGTDMELLCNEVSVFSTQVSQEFLKNFELFFSRTGTDNTGHDSETLQ